MTFFLNSASNLSSNGWKLPAEGVNESCMSERRERGGGGGGGGGELAGPEELGWEGQMGALSVRSCEH